MAGSFVRRPMWGYSKQQVDEGLNAGLDPPRALGRMGGDVIEDCAKVGKGR